MQGRVDYLNPAFTRVYGWTPDECLGRRMDRFVPADAWETVRQGLDRLMLGHRLAPVDTRRYTKDGRQIEVSISGAVYRDREGGLIGCVTIHRDISELRRLEKEVMDIGDQERQNIGHDLHDDLAPHLIGIEGLCAVMARKLTGRFAPEAELAGNIKQLIQEAIAKTRRLARGLCPVYLVDHGLEASLKELAANTAAVFNIACRFRCDIVAPVRDNVTATHVFRIAQEALHNAVRHGRARRIEMTLTREADQVRLTVADDGSGMPAEPNGGGMGLRIMGFRARIIGGILEIGANPDRGCRVVLTLPGPEEVHPT
jgi:PAS domain S-box-containing protein